MNPYPLVGLNHFTVPLAIVVSRLLLTAATIAFPPQCANGGISSVELVMAHSQRLLRRSWALSCRCRGRARARTIGGCDGPRHEFPHFWAGRSRTAGKTRAVARTNPDRDLTNTYGSAGRGDGARTNRGSSPCRIHADQVLRPRQCVGRELR